MKIGINFTLDVPPDKVKDLYEFMQTNRADVRALLNEEAALHLHEYLDENRIPNTLIRTWEKT